MASKFSATIVFFMVSGRPFVRLARRAPIIRPSDRALGRLVFSALQSMQFDGLYFKLSTLAVPTIQFDGLQGCAAV